MGGQAASDADVVRALRDAAPYVVSHRGKTVTVAVPGGMLVAEQLPAFFDDVNLLGKVAGIRFAVAFDAVFQAGLLAEERGVRAGGIGPGRTAVSEGALDCLRDAAHGLRGEIELVLSSGASGIGGIGTVTGAPAPARKAGVAEGTDLGLMGVPKEMDREEAEAMLGTGKAVLLPPLGAGVDGEALHLDAREVALAFACACRSDKLVVIADGDEAAELDFREMTSAEARERLEAGGFTERAAALVKASLAAIDAGVERVHVLDGSIEGGLLLELLSPDGVAAMVSRDPFDAVRDASLSDICSIAELIAPGVASGALLPRSVQEIAGKVGSFAVVSRDDALIACACLERHGDSAEFGCLAVRPDYANNAYGNLLLDFFEDKARRGGIGRMLVVTTQAADWFRERGYAAGDPSFLPQARREGVEARSAAVLEKRLS